MQPSYPLVGQVLDGRALIPRDGIRRKLVVNFTDDHKLNVPDDMTHSGTVAYAAKTHRLLPPLYISRINSILGFQHVLHGLGLADYFQLEAQLKVGSRKLVGTCPMRHYFVGVNYEYGAVPCSGKGTIDLNRQRYQCSTCITRYSVGVVRFVQLVTEIDELNMLRKWFLWHFADPPCSTKLVQENRLRECLQAHGHPLARILYT